MSIEIAIEVNELVNKTMQELLGNITNKQGILHTIENLITGKNTLTMEVLVKRAYGIKNQDRINELKSEIKKEVAGTMSTDGKPLFSNESKRNAEIDIRINSNTEAIYLNAQIDNDKNQILQQELIINNQRKLIEIAIGLLKTL